MQKRLDANPNAPMIQELAALETKAKAEYAEKKSLAAEVWEAEAEVKTKEYLLGQFPIRAQANVQTRKPLWWVLMHIIIWRKWLSILD
jgi:hypothetical protein